jgi:hypothetical protein
MLWMDPDSLTVNNGQEANLNPSVANGWKPTKPTEHEQFIVLLVRVLQRPLKVSVHQN